MIKENKLIWIETAYKEFALHGISALKVEPIANLVGKSKSSFYHHFADMTVFENYLLEHHLNQSKIIARKEADAININPEIINILVEHRIDLLFNRELRIHQNVQRYDETLKKSTHIIGDAFFNTWMKELNLEKEKVKLEGLFNLALENFFLQLNKDRIQFNWLAEYLQHLNLIAKQLTQ